MKIAIVGAGRAGISFALALRDVGHEVELRHHDELGRFDGVELVLLLRSRRRDRARREPDSRECDVRRRARGGFAHARGAGGPRASGFVAPARRDAHRASRRASTRRCDLLRGRRRVRWSTSWPRCSGRAITLRDDQRTLYHATATVASNHVVALMGQVQRLAEAAGLTLEDFLALEPPGARATSPPSGPEGALTGPASSGDMATIDAHFAPCRE